MRKELQCPNCGKREEVDVKKSEVTFCVPCGVEMEWAPTGMSFGLKGGGWPSKSFKRDF